MHAILAYLIAAIGGAAIGTFGYLTGRADGRRAAQLDQQPIILEKDDYAMCLIDGAQAGARRAMEADTLTFSEIAALGEEAERRFGRLDGQAPPAWRWNLPDHLWYP